LAHQKGKKPFSLANGRRRPWAELLHGLVFAVDLPHRV
jgi:hypothetical protein